MEATVSFRDFEERDIDFIYRCKNDEKLNSMIVGEWHPFTYEEAVKWVHGCMGEHDTYKFWAVCTNDEEQRIVGWVSVSQINKQESSACFHGIVLADPDYQNGLAWIESYLFIYDYLFITLDIDCVYGSALVDHLTSQTMRRIMYGKTVEVRRKAILINGVYHDVSKGELHRTDYIEHKSKGDYEIRAILKRLKKAKSEAKNA